jgi:peptide/nickel transport system permease protein
MKTFLLRRLLATIPLLLAVTFLTQTLLILSPGDYFTRLQDNPSMTPERLQMLRSRYRLDSKNVFVRYGYWIKGVATADFGYSFKFQTSVWSLIRERVFNTLLLAVAALVISYGLAIPLGVISALKRDTIFDRLAGGFSFFALSIPSVFFSLLMVLFAAHTGLFPIGGVHNQVYWDYYTPWQKVTDTLWHLVLPASVLGLINMAQYMRQMRGEMVETLSQDYIRTARAKGLSRAKVLYRHALGNAINPIITLFGFSAAYLLSGAFLTEFVFSWPGMGRLTIEALLDKDEPLVMASIVMVTLMLVFGGILADVLLAVVDPRIRLE